MRHALLVAALTLAALAAAADPGRDPFEAYEQPTIAPGSAPLQRFTLEELRLRGVVSAIAAPRALLESPDGAHHTARVGDLIGTNWGRIAAIRGDAIAVVERYRDAIGGVHERRVELALPARAATPARTPGPGPRAHGR